MTGCQDPTILPCFQPRWTKTLFAIAWPTSSGCLRCLQGSLLSTCMERSCGQYQEAQSAERIKTDREGARVFIFQHAQLRDVCSMLSATDARWGYLLMSVVVVGLIILCVFSFLSSFFPIISDFTTSQIFLGSLYHPVKLIILNSRLISR